MDQLRDTYNMVHGCEVANEAEKEIAIRQASGFNELFEAALKKECQSKGESSLVNQGDSGSGSKGKGKEKEKQQSRPEVQALKDLTKFLIQGGNMMASKWTWGEDLTEEDLDGLIRGANRQHDVSHSGYDSELPAGSLQSQTSAALDPVNLEDPSDRDLWFEDLSTLITIIPELCPHEIPTYSISFGSFW